MRTLRESVEQKLEQAKDAQIILSWCEENYPELLEIESTTHWHYGWGQIEFAGRRATVGSLAAKVASALGIEDSFNKDIDDEGTERTKHKIPDDDFKYGDVTVKTTVYNRGCKRYRVVEEKEIEICGELDEGKYLDVEELD